MPGVLQQFVTLQLCASSEQNLSRQCLPFFSGPASGSASCSASCCTSSSSLFS
eukprot:CAMPEP_0171127200 /NCGR_PEP_ID=MMETSP0766_2-20121228/114847_1 /TAXON_ID=439317 /ORGANISM="Gambierdiscus australes, Strain CAWD 149" /LENGTH=52 /DNA_ID=CAMNT_0011590289 /DNA_START=196 /DNA_END=351 /DNA_ORIENTATION=+